MNFAKIYYKTQDAKLLAIIEALKIRHNYLKDYKYEVIIFMDYNNLR